MSPVRFVTYVSGPDKQVLGGEGGIRTHGTLAGTTVFETAPIDHSGTSPREWGQGLSKISSGAASEQNAEFAPVWRSRVFTQAVYSFPRFNQFVHKGDLLILIYPTNYKIAVHLAEAAVQ
jgi:hypothetical protein